MEDVGNAEGKCKNYAKHSGPGRGSEQLASGYMIW
jgi:hypothetical protein